MMDTIKDFPISIAEVIRARKPVYEHMQPTPLIQYDGLSAILGVHAHVKHENHNPTGSFKIRGGINLMSHLKANGIKGVITFSTGNHGISIASAASWFGMKAVVVVPENNNPSKNRIIRQAGAELIEAGSTFEEASKVVESLCKTRGLYYVHPAEEPHLINGVGTEFLEVMEDLPDVDAVIVPVGAGSEAAAAAVTLKAVKPEIEIYAVQAEKSPAAYHSWKEGRLLTAPNTTFAGGFATGAAYETPFGIYKAHLTDFIRLSEDELYEGIALAGFYTRNLVEGAGGSTIMAAIKLKDQLQGKRVVLQFSGCNASPEEIRFAYQLPSFSNGYAA
ncbi:MAG: pyridoxal-phosphate dependent enzyme [Desulfobacterium sp.]|nr:pyridoxal-phosphate dependent enzyme [Desulfobacterium sp.]